MKQIRLDFTQDNPCLDGHILGHIGEHNATELVITPPVELAENEVVKSYIIVFVTGGKSILSESFDKTETLTVALWQQLTLNPVLGVQLEAYDDEGEFIGKSEYVTGLRFLASADGKSTEADSDNQSFISMFLKTKHSHENKDALDSFGMNNLGTRATFKSGYNGMVYILATTDDVRSSVLDVENKLGNQIQELHQLPEVTESDNGKCLVVKNGEWVMADGGVGGKVKKIFIPYDVAFNYGCCSIPLGSDVSLYATNNFLNEFGLSNILPVGLTVLWKGSEMSIAELNYKAIVGVPSASHVTLLDPVDVDGVKTDKLFAIIHNADGTGDTLLNEVANDNSNGYIGGVYFYYVEKIEVVE